MREINMTLINELKQIVNEDQLFVNEPMKLHTSFKIGGPAKVLIKPQSCEEIKGLVDCLNTLKQDFLVIGNGSNILVPDEGLDTVVIKISEGFEGFEIDGNTVRADAGILLSTLSKHVMNAELEGFEFASGIPGTIGGAVFMNAGAYGGEMKDCVKSVRVMDQKGKIFDIEGSDMAFAYRTSRVHQDGLIVLSVLMTFEKGDFNDIKAYTDELTEKRTSKQPLDKASAGSTFKRPEGYYAGKLIDDAGLRGFTYKGAQVSNKHCGFVINTGEATAEDVITLIQMVQKIVLDTFGVLMEPEVRLFGRD